MVTRQATRRDGVVIPAGQEMIAIPDEIDGHAIVRYFASDEEADAAFGADSIAEAIALLGAWGDLDWEEAVKELDRIEQDRIPTPPIDMP
jgi:hypothetical protein